MHRINLLVFSFIAIFWSLIFFAAFAFLILLALTS